MISRMSDEHDAEIEHGGELPVRPCHADCGVVDDHPRVQLWNNLGNGVDGIELYHYDDECLPASRLDAAALARLEPIRQARRDGKRGQALRDVAERLVAREGT